MGAYLQLGYQSDNLVLAPALSSFAGAILSPVNYAEIALTVIAQEARFRRSSDVIFDPQLYVPRTQRQELRDWSYYPSDVDSADIVSPAWWEALVDRVVEACARVGVDGICSPIALPREFNHDYFGRCVETGGRLAKVLENAPSRPLQSVAVGLDYLAIENRPLEVASIVSKTPCEEVYLVMVAPDVEPRRELADPEQLKGAMRLIAALERAGLKVLVAFASSEMPLWKAAGATHCATGKFFNLRRFTRTRFEEPPAGGGGALSYWFEQSLFAFLRASDVVRVRPHGLLDMTVTENPFAKEILERMDETPGAAWIALGWRQFLWWFIHAEAAVNREQLDAAFEAAENNWLQLAEAKPRVLMEEPLNNGSWIRAWRRAVLEF